MDGSNKPDNDNEQPRRPYVDFVDHVPGKAVGDAQSTEKLIRIGLAVLIFILACAAMAYFWNN